MPMIASDGSSLGSVVDGKRSGEGPGAFGVVIRFEDDHPNAPGFVQEMSGGRRSTTTGEIELLGFICALETVRAHREALEADPTDAIATAADRFTIVLDSEYVAKGWSEHLDQWAENRWRTSSFRAIRNHVLWGEVWDLRGEIGAHVDVVHVNGHTLRAGVVDADPRLLANDAADRVAGIASRAIREGAPLPKPHPVVWRRHADANHRRDADVRQLASLAERVLLRHGRGAAVAAFRDATASSGVVE